MFADQRGYALPLVLVVIVVFTLLGIALLQYSTTETIQVSRTEDRMQAYYLARSGAEAMAEHILSNPSTAAALYDGKTGIGSIDDLPEGSFSLEIEEDVGNIVIESTGYFGNVEEHLTLTLALMSPDTIFENAIFSNSAMPLNGLKNLDGDVSSNNDITGAPNNRISGVNYPNRDWYFTEPVLPEGLPLGGTISAGNHDISLIDSSHQYSGISTQPNGTIKFDTSDGDLEIVVTGKIEIKGGFVIEGSNNVYLFLNGTGNEIKTQDGANYNADQMFIFLTLGSELTIKTGNRAFQGFIYAPNATVNLESAEALGSIVAKDFNGSAQASMEHKETNLSAADMGKYVTIYQRWYYSN